MIEKRARISPEDTPPEHPEDLEKHADAKVEDRLAQHPTTRAIEAAKKATQQG